MIRLPNGTEVNCKSCTWCRSNRVSDLVGRCLAEQRHSSSTLALTLTYAGDGPQSSVLVYSDVQNFFKRLRSRGYKVRYLVVGEYGSRKGRAHWHCVLFFRGPAPALDMSLDDDGKSKRQHFDGWPHGFVYPQTPDYGGFRYLLKYVLKHELPEVAEHHMSLSKKPPLGAEMFFEMADEMVAQRLAFHSPEYAFADVRGWDKRLGRHTPRQFWLQGRMLEMMCEHYVRRWKEAYGGWPPDTDFLMERYFDPIAKMEMERDETLLIRRVEERKAEGQLETAARERLRREKEPQLAYMMMPGDYGIAVLYKDGRMIIHPNEEEGSSWHLDVGRKDAEIQLRELDLKADQATAIADWAHFLLRREENSRARSRRQASPPLNQPETVNAIRSGHRA